MSVTGAVDLGLVAIANAVNLLLTAIFLARARGAAQLEAVLGWVTVALALPVLLCAGLNAAEGRARWTVVLPALLVLFLLVEYVLDYWLRLDFRHTRLLWPYLLLFYVAVNAMTGYAFLVGTLQGAITLVTYFVCLLATWYAYRAVGHGPRRA